MPAQAAVREESWNEKQFKIMAVWNNVSICSVVVTTFSIIVLTPKRECVTQFLKFSSELLGPAARPAQAALRDI